MRTATLWVAEGAVNLRMTFCREVVDELKARVPSENRKWHPQPYQYWQIDPSFGDVVVEILQRYKYNINYIEQKGQATADTACTELIAMANDEELAKFKRMLLKRYHPDHGGDAAKASRVNELFELIMSRRRR